MIRRLLKRFRNWRRRRAWAALAPKHRAVFRLMGVSPKILEARELAEEQDDE